MDDNIPKYNLTLKFFNVNGQPYHINGDTPTLELEPELDFEDDITIAILTQYLHEQDYIPANLQPTFSMLLKPETKIYQVLEPSGGIELIVQLPTKETSYTPVQPIID